MLELLRPRPPAARGWPLLAGAAAALVLAGCAAPGAPPAQSPPESQSRSQLHPSPRSEQRASTPAERPASERPKGRKQVGKASIYAGKFHGRTMADGSAMSLHDDNAASKTLPLGSKARVKNLETGRSAIVTIQDRGPFVAGRIIDLSPATAAQIGLSKEEGLADVEVTPLGPDDAETVGSRDR